MHIYIDTRTNEPVLIKGSHLPLLRPLSTNRSPDQNWDFLPDFASVLVNGIKNAFSDEERRGRIIKMGYTKEQTLENPEQIAAEALLITGVYVDSDFKHTCYLKALEIAKEKDQKIQDETNRIALLFGFPTREQVLTFVRKYPALLPKFREVANHPHMQQELAKHNIKKDGFIAVFEEVASIEGKESKERKKRQDRPDPGDSKTPLPDPAHAADADVVVSFSPEAVLAASHTLSPSIGEPAPLNGSKPSSSQKPQQ